MRTGEGPHTIKLDWDAGPFACSEIVADLGGAPANGLVSGAVSGNVQARGTLRRDLAELDEMKQTIELLEGCKVDVGKGLGGLVKRAAVLRLRHPKGVICADQRPGGSSLATRPGAHTLQFPPVRILLVEDHVDLRRAMRRILRSVPDVEVLEADSYDSALRATADAIDLMFVDIRLSDREEDHDGLRLLAELRRHGREIPAIVLTGSIATDDIREALRLGARDYVLKDELEEQLIVPLVTSFRERSMIVPDQPRSESRIRRDPQSGIVGSSSCMARVRRQIARVAAADVPVLILGETGTGKEMVARAIHDLSERRNEPLVAVNCAAIPSMLLESMLFGHERGAFTGAERRSPGRFATARSGTILLDEIGEMPLDLQAKFLRVLEDGHYLPVGAEQEVELRARVIASTNVDLAARVSDGRFRSDLFYRLDVVTIRLPALSQRVEDIAELVTVLNDALPRRLRYSPSAIEWLARRPWPGNVRELKNVLRRLSVMAEGEVVDVGTLVDLVPPTLAADVHSALTRLVDAALDAADDGRSRQQLLEKILIERAVVRSAGNKSAAARLVGLPRKVFTRRLEYFAANPNASSVVEEDDD